jgi:hypothetical protein
MPITQKLQFSFQKVQSKSIARMQQSRNLPTPMTDPHTLAAFNALAAQINAKLDALNARLDRMEARAVTMESAADQTLRELPWNPDWPEPPPLPDGKTRWVNRGYDWPMPGIETKGRIIYWLDSERKWNRAETFSHAGIHHIEAV